MKHRHKKSRWNPGIGGVVTSVRSGFSPKTLIHYAPVAGGAFLNVYVSGLIADRLPAGWQTGWKRIGVNVASAGLLSALVAMVAKKYAKPVFVGAMLQATVAALTPYVGPQVDKVVDAISPPPAPVAIAAPAATVKGYLGDFMSTDTPRMSGLNDLACCGQGVPEMEAPELEV